MGVLSFSGVATAVPDRLHDLLFRSEGVITVGIILKCVVIAAAITGVTVIAARFFPL